MHSEDHHFVVDDTDKGFFDAAFTCTKGFYLCTGKRNTAFEFFIDKIIKEKTIEEIKKGNNVILDYGLWEKETRAKYYHWAKEITPDVIFHAVQCDIELAKQRVLERTKKHSEEFYIDEDIFNDRLKRFEPMTNEEGFPVIFYKTDDE